MREKTKIAVINNNISIFLDWKQVWDVFSNNIDKFIIIFEIVQEKP